MEEAKERGQGAGKVGGLDPGGLDPLVLPGILFNKTRCFQGCSSKNTK